MSLQNPNQVLLDEANAAGAWFHAKKTQPIWVKMIERDQVVRTLEGEENVKAGHCLCRGEAGDIWPQTADQLASRYIPTEDVDAAGWRKHTPRPDAQGVLAAVIGHPFTVVTTWGSLKGKPGDFLVKNFGDRDTLYPADVWIVDARLFGATYERLKGGIRHGA